MLMRPQHRLYKSKRQETEIRGKSECHPLGNKSEQLLFFFSFQERNSHVQILQSRMRTSQCFFPIKFSAEPHCNCYPQENQWQFCQYHIILCKCQNFLYILSLSSAIGFFKPKLYQRILITLYLIFLSQLLIHFLFVYLFE